MSVNTAPIEGNILSRVYVIQAITRPVTILAFVAIYVFFSLTLMAMLLIGKTTIETSSALIMTIFGSISPVVAAQVIGRTLEKNKGKTLEPTVKIEEAASEPPLIAPTVVEDVDPMDELNRMDLSEYTPKVADDNPVIP